MTSFSNFVFRVFDDGTSEQLADLNLDRHGPGHLAAWAARVWIDKDKFHWVDSCWLKLSVSPDDVARYLDEFVDSAEATKLKASLDPSGAYRIDAEEF